MLHLTIDTTQKEHLLMMSVKTAGQATYVVSLRVALSLGGVPALQQLIVGLDQPARHFLCLSIWRGLRITRTLNLSLTEQSFLRLLILTMSWNGGTSGVNVTAKLNQVTQNTTIIVKLCVYCSSILSENFIFFHPTGQKDKIYVCLLCQNNVWHHVNLSLTWSHVMTCKHTSWIHCLNLFELLNAEVCGFWHCSTFSLQVHWNNDLLLQHFFFKHWFRDVNKLNIEFISFLFN